MKKILVVYPDPYLSYSPSTLNLYDALSVEFDVSILTFEPDANFSSQKITDKKVIYLKAAPADDGSFKKKILKKLASVFAFNKQKNNLLTYKAKALIKVIKQFEGAIIAVDFFALWCVQKTGRQAHLLSLEIHEKDRYREACSISVQSVIIQTAERYNFLFPGKLINTFYVQNAPVFIEEKNIDITKRRSNDLIFCGSAIPGFGIFSCLEFLKDFPSYTLTLKGAVPEFVEKIIKEKFADLLQQKRLIIDAAYLSATQLNCFISRFRIGFVFYDQLRFDFVKKFNYITAPSGKMFQYYNAGVPVIGSNISGLSSVADFKTGVLIDSLGSAAIKNAIDKIESNYAYFATNAQEASRYFDFNKNITPFIKYLKKNSYA